MSPARLAIALKSSTYKTLETLEVALGRERSHTDGTALGDLKSFVALKKLNVHSYVLLGGCNFRGIDHNPNTNKEPMLSEILPASLLHLCIHYGVGEVFDNNEMLNFAKHQRKDRDEVISHFAKPVHWGFKEWGRYDEPMQPYERVCANGLRVLKSARWCQCRREMFWDEAREFRRLLERLDVTGEDYKECKKKSIAEWW